MNETPVVNWSALDALADGATRGAALLRDSVRQLTVDDLRRLAAETGADPATTAATAVLLADLLGVMSDLAAGLRRVAPVLARALGDDPEQEHSPCPRCGGLVPICEVGTVACHRACGFCSHPAMDGDVCALCGAERGTLAWADAASLRPGDGGRVLMEKVEALVDEHLAKGGTGEPPAGVPRVGAMGFGHD